MKETFVSFYPHSIIRRQSDSLHILTIIIQTLDSSSFTNAQNILFVAVFFYFSRNRKKNWVSIDWKYQFRGRLHNDADWKLWRAYTPHAVKYWIHLKIWMYVCMFLLVWECLSWNEIVYFATDELKTIDVSNGQQANS